MESAKSNYLCFEVSTPTRAAFVSRLLVMEIGKLNFCTPEVNWVFMHT